MLQHSKRNNNKLKKKHENENNNYPFQWVCLQATKDFGSLRKRGIYILLILYRDYTIGKIYRGMMVELGR